MAGLPENLREYFNMSAGMPSVYSSKEVEQWAAAEYEQSDFMPEAKTHTTSWGLKVRSKSVQRSIMKKESLSGMSR